MDRQDPAVKFHRASSVTVAAIKPVTKCDDGCVETNQLPTFRSIGGRLTVLNS
ncbi:hypothetical protein BZL29_4836 [Mycobacterium kansasii]|uniref:Uncharacterized protein n=1 Tax=Mycobacterium kansasii TaxID=1768 RepID=A0A1V3X0F9_MYCKA|nr:hypothetical protein BZL29_4836 [Mycobacterium kansasii]